ncbi:MAG TPA: DNA polymerase I [Oceanithermus profundus]|uniref:DNA polymerase I n=1 Tax=Oceanithermus profundus TaxID=187137 RepID=A0A7C4V6W1_9DEIN|nr:DNA polymerase I [Oceanithermus profundus]
MSGVQQPGLFESKPKRIVLVDGHHLAFRSYYALKDAGLTTSRGEPVHAVYGFARTLLKLLREDGDCVIVVFDAPGPSFRHEEFEGYKAQRVAPPEDFRPQVEKIKELVDLLGLVRLEVPGVEADDVLATLAQRAAREGYEVVILTSDRDTYQLLTDRIVVVTPEERRITPDYLKEKYGVTPEQWVDYRALTGDPSDNIPGVKGVGAKTAAKLLAEWGSLDRLYAHLDEVTPPGVRKKLEEGREAAFFSREISRMRTEVPLDVDLSGCHRNEVDREGLRRFLLELEFGTLLRELGLIAAPTAQAADWPPPDNSWLGYVFDRPQPMWAELNQLAAAWDDRVAEGPPRPDELARFEKVHAIGAKDLTVWALSRDLSLHPGNDALLLAYLYDPSNNQPASTIRRYGAGDWSDEATGRALAAQQLWREMKDRLEGEERLWWLYREVEQPLQGVLAQMERRGVRLDVAYLKALSDELAAELARLEEEVHRLAGHPFNLNSRDQLETVLYDELGLAPSRRTAKTGKRSTSASALETLRGAHPIVEKILQYRELSKLKGTYLDPLPKLVHPRTGRLHTRFHQTGTATGRLSSSDPNLQNIPIRTELGRRIRKAFVAAEGHVLVVADYSQIELRVLAHLSGDENLQRIFREGRDIHTQTAAWMFGLDGDDVDPFQRRAAKTINFGVLYGMSAHRLSRELGIDYGEAQAFIDRYFDSYPGVRAFMERVLAEARERGYVETLFGRRRHVPELLSKARNVREAAERVAFNMPVQGTAADLIKLAMVKLAPRLEPLGAALLLQVHDELVVEAPEAHAEEAARAVKTTMEGVWELDVPLAVDVGIGRDWLEAK